MSTQFWRPRSLLRRQLLVSTLGLAAFLALVGIALDRAFEQTAQENLRMRLSNYALAYAARTDFDINNALLPPAITPDPRLDRPASGLYAQIVQRNNVRWQSQSTVYGPPLPSPPLLEPNQETFSGPVTIRDPAGFGSAIYIYGHGFAWSEGGSKAPVPFTIYVMEDMRPFKAQMNTFRRALWGNLALAGLLLVLLQMATLWWSLSPLKRVITELDRVKEGMATKMSGYHPRELTPLTESINALIDSERRHLDRQRDVMSDLAHSLKTPLAVLRSQLDSHGPDAELRGELDTQLRRMNDIVGYQLGRARSTGHKLYAAPIAIESYAEEIVTGLEKIYASKGVLCEFEIAPEARFHGELGDLQELLGNLLENAFKWARSRVLLTVVPRQVPGQRRAGLRISVEDDGPGVPKSQVMEVLQRGVRGDERVQGHGIGLSIVQDILANYGGELEVSDSTEMGGARFEALLPPPN
ncbi:ATP-binding protein [Solilutibacter silvestris]|uniref:histidine kinase n=1 Tax=Solilutibacter silvestris TaxID=1645665 RepID=A0A2K1Q277_9GAMM|nr:ATP-binding protein [Lysobacter silvestris]PNS09160.1 Histidine kinase-, DNA gyrase B-, and HSP90-like ATPase [Lysobacter silvestris]